MPNYKLSSAVKEEIVDHAVRLTERRVTYAMSDFPLTVATLQYRLMRDDQLKLLHELEGTGYQLMAKTNNFMVGIVRGDLTPVMRSAAVELWLPECVHVPRNTWANFYATTLEPNDVRDTSKVHHLMLHSVNDANEIQALVKWTNAAVREKRLQEITLYAVKKVLEMCNSTAHLLSAWPMLATLVEDTAWRSRLRHPPKGLHKWAPPSREFMPLVKAIKAAEVVLTSAQMTEDYKYEPGVTRAHVKAWERLPNDQVFT